jgi:hypothetical protein
MIKLPSYGSSILAAAVCTPVLILGVDYIEKNSKNQFLEFTWFIVWFFLPVLISTVDLGDIRKRRQSWQFRAEDFRRSCIPTWKRMLLYFVSACMSALILKLFGIGLG